MHISKRAAKKCSLTGYIFQKKLKLIMINSSTCLFEWRVDIKLWVLEPDCIRRIGSALARLKGNLFINTAQLLQRPAPQQNFDYMRQVENGLAHLLSWLVFTKRINPLEASWLAHIMACPGAKTGWCMCNGIKTRQKW